MMRHCDTLLLVGTSFPYAEFLPEEDQARAVQIDIDAANLGLRYPTEVNLHGDAAATLEALLERVTPKQDTSWRADLEERIADWWDTVEARAYTSAEPLNPQRIFWELSSRLPDDTRLAADVGTATDWYARFLKVNGKVQGTTSGGLASMGNGVPYALAAKFAEPDKPVVAMVGDGAMQMIGNNGLITAAHYWREWSDPRLVILVLNNRDLNQVTWEQRVMEGDPKYQSSQALPDFDYDRYAEMLGLRGPAAGRPGPGGGGAGGRPQRGPSGGDQRGGGSQRAAAAHPSGDGSGKGLPELDPERRPGGRPADPPVGQGDGGQISETLNHGRGAPPRPRRVQMCLSTVWALLSSTPFSSTPRYSTTPSLATSAKRLLRMPMPPPVASSSSPRALTNSALPSASMVMRSAFWSFCQASITKASLVARQAITSTLESSSSASTTKPGMWVLEHPGVNAPGTANNTTLRPLKNSPVGEVLGALGAVGLDGDIGNLVAYGNSHGSILLTWKL
jgi:hypothetical protein